MWIFWQKCMVFLFGNGFSHQNEHNTEALAFRKINASQGEKKLNPNLKPSGIGGKGNIYEPFRTCKNL